MLFNTLHLALYNLSECLWYSLCKKNHFTLSLSFFSFLTMIYAFIFIFLEHLLDIFKIVKEFFRFSSYWNLIFTVLHVTLVRIYLRIIVYSIGCLDCDYLTKNIAKIWGAIFSWLWYVPGSRAYAGKWRNTKKFMRWHACTLENKRECMKGNLKVENNLSFISSKNRIKNII